MEIHYHLTIRLGHQIVQKSKMSSKNIEIEFMNSIFLRKGRYVAMATA
jgi:hypothetical protein